MRRIVLDRFAVLAGLLAFGAAGCGDLLPWGGGGGGGGSIVVRGNIDGVLPVSDRDIVVFVYTTDEPVDDCEKPEIPTDKPSSRSTVLQDGEVLFEVKSVKEGRLVVAFLLDNEGKDADGRIDEGDPVAVLDDPDCILEEVGKNFTIEMDDVQVNFTDAPAVDFADPGRALAADLDQIDEDN